MSGAELIARLGRATQIDRVRRNHALEHATITIISEWRPDSFLRGRSNRKGFFIFGDTTTEELRTASAEALRRLRAGEASLAIHPRCGTNLAVAGILSGVSAALAAQLKPRQNRYSYAILASLAALSISPRLGFATQQHLTTLADLGTLKIESVERSGYPFLRDPVHFIATKS